jgi:hypothetical protein
MSSSGYILLLLFCQGYFQVSSHIYARCKTLILYYAVRIDELFCNWLHLPRLKSFRLCKCSKLILYYYLITLAAKTD